MKIFSRGKIVAGAALSLLFAATSTASATDYVTWYGYPGHQSSWHCNSTGDFNLGGAGWAYVQACVSRNGNYFQALYNVSFSQAHANVTMHVNDYYYYYDDFGFADGPYDWGNASDRQCSSSTNGTIATCFARTETGANTAAYVLGHADSIVVDGIGYSLTTPSSGPAQDYSPTA